MHILTVNCGSSSLKFQVVDADAGAAVLQGEVASIGRDARLRLAVGGERREDAVEAADQAQAAALVTLTLQETPHPPIDAVAHRVVHGGRFHEPLRLDAAGLAAIESAAALAPLHNGPALAAARAFATLLPDVPAVAVFDTAFHATLPEKARRYAIDRELADRHGIRRYGFHGLAHAYMAARWSQLSGRALTESRLITLQLGSGCSACAIAGGRSVDTSMGFTPLEGLVMETRSGDIDAAIVPFLSAAELVPAGTVESWLNERSGLQGLAGRRDMRDLLAAEAKGDSDAAAAIEMFVYRVQKYIGAYLMVLGGADAIVFGGGVGENAPEIRRRIVGALGWLGVDLDATANAGAAGIDARLSAPASAIEVWAIAVDEGKMLAREAARVLSGTGVEAGS